MIGEMAALYLTKKAAMKWLPVSIVNELISTLPEGDDPVISRCGEVFPVR